MAGPIIWLIVIIVKRHRHRHYCQTPSMTLSLKQSLPVSQKTLHSNRTNPTRQHEAPVPVVVPVIAAAVIVVATRARCRGPQTENYLRAILLLNLTPHVNKPRPAITIVWSPVAQQASPHRTVASTYVWSHMYL